MFSPIGPDRVMMGSVRIRVMMGADLPGNVPVEIAEYRALGLKPEVYDKVMGKTAVGVFHLTWPNGPGLENGQIAERPDRN